MYKYEEQKQGIFTESGQEMFLSIRDKSKQLLKQAGCFKMGNVISGQVGDTWQMLACVDRLVELGEIREIEQNGAVAGQDRIFVNAT